MLPIFLLNFVLNGCVWFFSTLEREELKELAKQYDKSENDLKALQSVGQVSKTNELMTSDDPSRFLFYHGINFVNIKRSLERFWSSWQKTSLSLKQQMDPVMLLDVGGNWISPSWKAELVWL